MINGATRESIPQGLWADWVAEALNPLGRLPAVSSLSAVLFTDWSAEAGYEVSYLII